MEIWKPAFGHEGIYEVSSLGRVKRVLAATSTTAGRILKPHNHNGYLHIDLCKNGKYTKISVHRLVMLSFTAERNETVNHKNGIRSDCRLENLEWMSHAENIKHGYRVLRHRLGSEHWIAKLDEGKVREARRLNAAGWSHQKIAEHFSISRPTITRAINGRTWRHVSFSTDAPSQST